MENRTKVTKESYTEENVPTLFSIRLPPELALYVRQEFVQYNVFIRALIQSYKDGRIEQDQVVYFER